jgi:hypothetical protein
VRKTLGKSSISGILYQWLKFTNTTAEAVNTGELPLKEEKGRTFHLFFTKDRE